MGSQGKGLLAMYACLSADAIEFNEAVPTDEETTPLNANGGDDQTRELDLVKLEEQGLELLLDDDSEGDALVAEGEQIDRTVEGLVALESFMGGQQKPVGDTALGCLRTALEALHKSLNLPDSVSPVLAVEGFDRVASAKRNWEHAHESMNQTLKAAGVRVLEWIKRFFQWLGDQMEGLFNRAETYAKTAREIQKAARAITHKGAPSQGGIAALDQLRFFSRGGTVMTPEEVLSRYQRYIQESNASVGVWAINDALKVLEDQQDPEKVHSTTATVINSIHSKTFGQFNRTNIKGDVPNATVWERELPFGSRWFELLIIADNLNRPSSILTRLVGRDAVNFDPNQKLRVLSIAQATQLCVSVEANMVGGFYRERTNMRSRMRKVQFDLERMAQNDGVRARHLQSTKALASELMLYLRTSANYELTVTKRLLAYAWSSVKAHQS